MSDWIEAERRVDRQLLVLATSRLVERLESGVATAAKTELPQASAFLTLAAGARTDWAQMSKSSMHEASLRGKLEELKDRSEELARKR